MTVMDGPKPANIIARIQGILLHPATEWDVIEGEATTAPGLLIGYVAPLAAIPAIATVLSHLLVSRWLLIPSLIGAVISYILAIVGVFVIAFIIDMLAPSFNGQKNQTQALKLVAYSFTAAWVGGILNIIPWVGPVLAGIAGLYSLYLLYLGLPKLMKPPADKQMAYFLVSLAIAMGFYIVVAIVVGIILTIITAMIVATGVAAGATVLTIHQ